MIQIPTSLIERIKTRQTVLVAGMGCCELAGLPGWAGLTERLGDWLDDDARKAEVRALVTAGRQSAATAYLRAKLSDEVIGEVIRDLYPPGKPIPPGFAVLGRIPWRGVVTTTFDDLWDRALTADIDGPTRVFLPTAADIAELRAHRGRFLLHIFGTSEKPETSCLSPADLRRRTTPSGVGPFLDEIYRKRSFVFVGFRPGDSDLTMLSERLLGASEHESEHFLLYPGEPGLESDLIEAEFGYTPVPYDGPLDDVLAALGDAWASVEAESRPSEDDVEAWIEIWTRDPSDPEPKAMLDRLETRLRDEKQWEKVVELLLARMELTDAAEHLRDLREVGRVLEVELDAPGKAFTAFATAFRLDSADLTVTADLERVAGKAGLWTELLTEYNAVAAEVADPALAARHYLEIARIYAQEVDQDENAIAAYRHVLSLEPRRREALEPLCDLLRKHERWVELPPPLEALAALEPDRAKEIELRLQLADLFETRLSQDAAAVTAAERVLELDSEAGEALAALDRLYRRVERWKDLARVLDRKADLSPDPAEANRLRKERADLLADKVGDTDSSLAALEAIVADDPMNRAALRSLETLYEKAGRTTDYLRTLDRLCAAAESDGERLLILRRVASEWEGRPDGLDHAADALEQVLQIDVHAADAFAALTRVYRAAKRWHALAEATVRQIDACDSPVAKRDLYVAVARIYEDDLRDGARAIAAYLSAEALGDTRDETLAALARLHEQQESWRACVEALDKRGQGSPDAAARAAIYFKAGTILADSLDDPAAAEDRYAKALENDPGHRGALSGLAALYLARGEVLRSAALMAEAAERSQNRIEKTRLLYEAGCLYRDRLEDETKAVDLFARTLALDPEHVGAGTGLADLYRKREQWALLEPVIDMLARKVGGSDAERAVDTFLRQAHAAQQLGNADKAVKAYEAALAADPFSLPALSGLAALRIERKESREARDLLQTLVEQGKRQLTQDQMIVAYGRLGTCEVALGDRDAALGWYERALGLDPAHRASLSAIADLHAEKGDYAAVVLDKRTLAAGVDGDEKARLLEEMGDVYLDRLGNPVQAIASYQQALELRPTRRQLLHKLLELYTAHKHWPPAAETLTKLAEQETSPAVRAKYAYTAAQIHRDGLDDRTGAVALFNRALDDAPDMAKAFDAVERILTETQDWRELARNYRRMIKRLPVEGLSDLRLRLWSGLGEVSLRHLEDREMATTAFEVAASLDRHNLARRERMAELYTQAGPDRADKAIAEHQFLLSKNPDRLASYRALAKLYGEVGARDKLWCVASTLTFLRKADAQLAAIYEQHKRPDLPTARRKLTEDLWAKLIHVEEDRFIAAIFMLAGPYIAMTSARQHHAAGLRRKERVDVAQDERMPTRALRYVSQALDLPVPDLFYKTDESQGLVLVNLREKDTMFPAFVVGAPFVAKSDEREVVFEMGKRMAFLRPERFLRYAVSSPAALDIALRAALALGGASIGPGAHNGEVDRLAAQLRKMVPNTLPEQLGTIGKKLSAARGDTIDVAAWMTAADLTASRVGFVLTGDLTTAARVISAEPPGGSTLAAKARLKDLLAFSVSEEYFALRRALGLELGETS